MLKIVSKQREQYIPQVKETLDNPDFILKDIDDMVILAKKIGDKQYFTSINLETEDFLISVSNAPKKENVLKNKVENEAKIVYQSPNASSISQTLLQTSLYSANKIDMLDYNEKKMKSQAIQGEQAMDMLRQEHEEKGIDKEKEFNRNKINRFGGKKK